MFVLTLSVNSDIRCVRSQPEEQSSYQLDGVRIILSGNIVAIFMPIPTFLLVPESAQEFTTVLVTNRKQGITDEDRLMEDINDASVSERKEIMFITKQL